MSKGHGLDLPFIESRVCGVVSGIVGEAVSAGGIYSTRKGSVVLARQYAQYAFHDIYGLSYRIIAERSGVTESAVMRAVGKVRVQRFVDAVVRRIDVEYRRLVYGK